MLNLLKVRKNFIPQKIVQPPYPPPPSRRNGQSLTINQTKNKNNITQYKKYEKPNAFSNKEK